MPTPPLHPEPAADTRQRRISSFQVLVSTFRLAVGPGWPDAPSDLQNATHGSLQYPHVTTAIRRERAPGLPFSEPGQYDNVKLYLLKKRAHLACQWLSLLAIWTYSKLVRSVHTRMLPLTSVSTPPRPASLQGVKEAARVTCGLRGQHAELILSQSWPR